MGAPPCAQVRRLAVQASAAGAGGGAADRLRGRSPSSVRSISRLDAASAFELKADGLDTEYFSADVFGCFRNQKLRLDQLAIGNPGFGGCAALTLAARTCPGRSSARPIGLAADHSRPGGGGVQRRTGTPSASWGSMRGPRRRWRRRWSASGCRASGSSRNSGSTSVGIRCARARRAASARPHTATAPLYAPRHANVAAPTPPGVGLSRLRRAIDRRNLARDGGARDGPPGLVRRGAHAPARLQPPAQEQPRRPPPRWRMRLRGSTRTQDRALTAVPTRMVYARASCACCTRIARRTPTVTALPLDLADCQHRGAQLPQERGRAQLRRPRRPDEHPTHDEPQVVSLRLSAAAALAPCASEPSPRPRVSEVRKLLRRTRAGRGTVCVSPAL